MQKLNQEQYVEGLFSFIDKSPSPFHAIDAIKEITTQRKGTGDSAKCS